MPESAVRTFSDPDDYTAVIRATEVEVTVSARGSFAAKLIRIDLHQLWMQCLSESLPRVMHSALVPGRAIITFRTQPGPSMLWSGVDMRADNITRHSEGHEAYQLSSGPARFGAMSLPVEDMVSVGETMGGFDLTPPRDTLSVIPSPVAIARLHRLHAAAGYLAENAPEIIAQPEAARGLEQALIEAMVDCLGERQADEDKSAQRRHSLIMRRFRRAVEENPDRALYIPELAAEIGVSLSTLRTCCHEQLGISPKRYLMLRRMHLARQDLRDSAPGMITVTDIATRYGFFQFGRFAGEYVSLFGESPSATLRGARDGAETGRSDFRIFVESG